MIGLHIDYETFGGEMEVLWYFFHIGPLSTKCGECSKQGTVEYAGDRTIPRMWCSKCGVKSSCSAFTEMQEHGIRDVPLFLFVAHRFGGGTSDVGDMGFQGHLMPSVEIGKWDALFIFIIAPDWPISTDGIRCP